MGIFSDRCDALINPQTGRVLTGPELEEAGGDASWPRCGHKVKKAARFCSKCGAGAPGGWVKCSSCGSWVGNDSRFCWNCKAELRPEERGQYADGVWRKPVGLLAQRFEIGDLSQEMKHGIRVQAGTLAILLDGGKVKGYLEAGEHSVDSLLRKINHWGSPPPRSVVLVDCSELILPLRFGNLRTAEELPLEFYGELIILFDPKEAERFIVNGLKQERSLSYAQILEQMEGDLRHAVAAMCDAATIEDLVKDPERRIRLDAMVEEAAGKGLSRLGLQLVRTSSAEFISPEYEKLRQQMGEYESKRRELEFTQKLRELISSDRMHSFKDEHDLAEYVAQLAQEKEISAGKRDYELNRLVQVQSQQLQVQQVDFEMAEEMKKVSHQIGVKTQWNQFSRETSLADARTESEIYALKVDREIDETEKWLRIKELKKKITRDDLEERAKIFSGKDLTTLIMLEPDEKKREQLLILQKQQQQAGMSPEQILASVAEKSPEAAKALAQMLSRQREDLEREFAERKKLQEEHEAQAERMFNKTMEVASDAAKHRGNNDVNIVR